MINKLLPSKAKAKSKKLKKHSVTSKRTKLSPARIIFWRSLTHLTQNWKIYGGILLVYSVVLLLLVKGFAATSGLTDVKTTVESSTGGKSVGLDIGVQMFGVLVSKSGPASEVAGLYQTILFLIVSLALVWALRQTHLNKKPKIREAFYKGMYPLIPYILVIAMIGLQLIPLLLANMLFGFVFSSGIATTVAIQLLLGLLIFLMAVLSLYVITSSIFALYIVTLPDTTPLKALRSAKSLVRYRRWTIMRKLLFLPFALLLIAAFITVICIIYFTQAAEWVFFGLTISSLAAVHSYIYALYRELMA